MGGVVHSVTDAIGLTNYKAQEEAQRASSEASRQSLAMTKDQLEFQKKQYSDWKSIYGPIQDNLGRYYMNLDPTEYSQKQIEQLQVEFNKATKQIETNFAQRGLDDSGVAAATEVAMKSQEASQKAAIRSNAEDITAQKQMQFLGLGLGQGTQMLGIMGNVASSGAASQASIAGANISASAQLGAANVNAMGSALGTAAGIAFLSRQQNPKK